MTVQNDLLLECQTILQFKEEIEQKTGVEITELEAATLFVEMGEAEHYREDHEWGE